jgi:hypothetical protein
MSQTARPSRAVSAACQQAMGECKARDGGWGVQEHDEVLAAAWEEFDTPISIRLFRYAYIEACFKEKTGLYPAQANVNCIYRANDPDNPARGRNYFC